MGFREKINENPGIVTGITAGVIIIVLIIIVWQLLSGSRGVSTSSTPQQSYYTIDDGKTWFGDDANKIAPFTHEGKPAYQAMVFSCDGGKTSFIAYLQRYTADGRKEIEKAVAHGVPVGVGITPTYVEIKAPGTGDDAKKWMKLMDPRSMKLKAVTCPDGSQPEQMVP